VSNRSKTDPYSITSSARSKRPLGNGPSFLAGRTYISVYPDNLKIDRLAFSLAVIPPDEVQRLAGSGQRGDTPEHKRGRLSGTHIRDSVAAPSKGERT
jgi:hypothetical protein